jgi:hypothetical protein
VQEHLLVANVGDSKDVICRGGKAVTSSPTQLGFTDLLSSFTCLRIIIETSEISAYLILAQSQQLAAN